MCSALDPTVTVGVIYSINMKAKVHVKEDSVYHSLQLAKVSNSPLSTSREAVKLILIHTQKYMHIHAPM